LRSDSLIDSTFRREASVYGWFTEGFDTLDLKQAKALRAGVMRFRGRDRSLAWKVGLLHRAADLGDE
jgi:hypothetical protein